MFAVIRYRTTTFFALTTLFKLVCHAAVLHVPSEHATIQLALTATSSFDTVLVEPGRYHEFLMGPTHSYTLLGQFPPDSSEEELWTVLDPIPLPEADTPSTFITNGDTVVVKNLAFYNRPEIRQVDFPRRTGGIRNTSQILMVEDCRFDSVSDAIRRGLDVRVLRTVFQGGQLACVWTALDGRLEATQCTFDGNSSYSYILAYSGTTIESCVFTCNPTGHFIGLFGSGIRVRNSRFGPCDGNLSTFFLYVDEDVVVEECTFIGIEDVSIILEVNTNCTDTDFPPIIVRNCTFQDFNVRSYPMSFWCAESESPGNVGLMDGNSFVNGHAATSSGAAIDVSGTATLRNSMFENVGPQENPDVFVHTIASVGTLTARDNQFLPPGLAAATIGPPFDARWNWWGDSSGPYNAAQNPLGQGSDVGNGVEFIPWLTSPPDSGDTSEVAAEDRNVFEPSLFEMSAYPNPFNATTALEIEVARAGEYEVMMYDVTGRQVTQVFRGTINGRTTVRIDASTFASGVYFVKLSGDERILATEKLLLLK